MKKSPTGELSAAAVKKIEGRWWVMGKDKGAHFGTLSCSDSLELKVPIPHDLNVGGVIGEASLAHQVPKVIFGRNANNQPVSLFGCFCHRAISEGLMTLRIDAIGAVNGLEIKSWKQRSLRTVSIAIDSIASWLGARPILPVNNKPDNAGYTLPGATDLRFKISEGVEFGLWCSTSITSEQQRVTFEQTSSAWLQFDRPRSLKEISDNWVPWVERFLSLLVGSRVRHQSVICSPGKLFANDLKGPAKQGEVLLAGDELLTEERQLGSWEMVTHYPELSDRFRHIIARWTEVAKRYEPLIDLFFVAAFSKGLHTEAQFLFLVQALEVYHARSPVFESIVLPKQAHKSRVRRVVARTPSHLKDWVERTLRAANFKYLDVRLSEIFRAHRKEKSEIFGRKRHLAARVRYTRNQLTHRSAEKDSPKLFVGTELLQVAWNLRTFLWVCLLKEIGIDGAPLKRLIAKYKAQFTVL